MKVDIDQCDGGRNSVINRNNRINSNNHYFDCILAAEQNEFKGKGNRKKDKWI